MRQSRPSLPRDGPTTSVRSSPARCSAAVMYTSSGGRPFCTSPRMICSASDPRVLAKRVHTRDEAEEVTITPTVHI